MTINALYRKFLEELKAIYPSGESAKITQMVFESLAGMSRSDVIKTPEKLISVEDSHRLTAALDMLLANMPVQYVIGETCFFNLTFKTTRDVLIPRPETEELVEEVIKYLQSNPQQKKILDIGTGSGCIPIAIQKNTVHHKMVSIDISEAAIQIATENALLHQTEISFMQIDFLHVEKRNTLDLYDVIVSNPPYIPGNEMPSIEKHVKHYEPLNALFVPEKQPLLFYEAILQFSVEHLATGGKIFMEIHEDFGQEVARIFKENKFEVDLKKDIFGKDRIAIASLYP